MLDAYYFAGVFERVFYSDFRLKILNAKRDEGAGMKMLHQICTVRVYIGETLVGNFVKSDLSRTTSDGINGEGCGIFGGEGRTSLPKVDRYLSTREILSSALERIVGGRETVPNKYPWMVLLLKISPSGNDEV